MLRSLIFAVVLGLVAASPMGPSGGMGMGPFADEHSPLSGQAAEELMKLAREVVGEGQAECDNEEEVYKWYPPLPCRVENSTYDTLAQRMCPEDGQCNVGPVDTTLNTSSVRVFFCSRPGKYMLYQACRVQNAQTGEERQASGCASYNGETVGCTVGPFSVLSNRTNYIAYYCDTTMMDSLQKVAARGIVSQACRVENQYGDDMLRRMCPPGYRCNHGPMEGEMNDMPVQAYLCKEEEMEWEWTLSETVHYLVVEKEVDPFVILMVMRNLQDHGISITPRVVHDLVLEQVKAHLQEMAKEREEQDKKDPKENIESIMHMLEHRRLLDMQVELRRRMFEEKDMGKEDNVEELMHMLHHISLVAMEEKLTGKQDEGSMAAELLKGMMGQKMGRDEEEKDGDMGLEDLLKHMMGQKKEEMSEEARIKLTLRRASFVRAVIGKVQEVGEKGGDDEMKMMLLLKGVHDLLEENKDIMEGLSGEVRVVKVMKAINYVKNDFEGADKENDADVKWMLVIAKQALMREKEAAADEEERQMKQMLEMLKDKKEEREEDNPLKELMDMMMEKKEDREDKDPMKLLMKMMMEKKDDREEEEKDPMKMLMMMMKKKEEEEEEKDPLKMLMMMMMKMNEKEEEKDPMKMLLAHMMGEKMPEEREQGDMLQEIMSALKEMMEKKNGDDNEGAQLMAFVKAMMGGEGDVQDAMHWLHHMHAIKMEAEIREKYEEMSKQRESESKAQELLQFLHSSMQQRQMGYGMPQMGGRW